MMPPALSKLLRTLLAASLTLAAGSGPAAAQILRGGALPSLPGGLPPIGTPLSQLPERTVAGLPRASERVLDAAAGLTPAAAMQLRTLQVQRLIREHADLVEADEHGAPVVRGAILALSPSATALDRARQAGFAVRTSATLQALGLQAVTLAAPRGLSATEALRRLRAIDPTGQYDLDHIYQEGGAAGAGRATPATAELGRPSGKVRVGLIDGAVAPDQPALRSARVVQRAFAPGGARITAHATAVASLLAGERGRFHGAAPGATVLAADVYGPTAAGGSADAIVRALAWLADQRTAVINISLVGPPNLLLEAAVKAMIARGHLLVAAVGNDGPAAPPLYPAAYSGVIAVTAVDGARRVLPEAGRGSHVDFAAPGAQMAAAGVDGGFVAVRGTSFAAPIVAGELARLLPGPDRDRAAGAVAQLAAAATDLGAPGRDAVYGRGLVGFDLRTEPAAVGAHATPLRGP